MPISDPSNFEELGKGNRVIFSYDVKWEKSNIEWHNRWDIYFQSNSKDDKVHWFSITNSFVVVLFLSAMVAIIMIRALYRDIAQYNAVDAASEVSAKGIYYFSSLFNYFITLRTCYRKKNLGGNLCMEMFLDHLQAIPCCSVFLSALECSF